MPHTRWGAWRGVPGQFGDEALGEAKKILGPLLPTAVHCSEATRSMWEADLAPDEARIVEGAAEKRRVAFAAGRACAHRALAQLGIEGASVPRGDDRAPVWPDGIVGSITHCDSHCAAAVASAGDVLALGIDVDESARMTSKLLDRITTPDERKALAACPDELERGAVIFSAKESVYKAYHPSTGAFLGFEDIEIELFDDGRFTAHLTNTKKPTLFGRRKFDGRYVLTGQHAGTVVVVDQG